MISQTKEPSFLQTITRSMSDDIQATNKVQLFLFPRNFIEIEDSLSDRLKKGLSSLLEGRKVIVSARNLRRTLADKQWPVG